MFGLKLFQRGGGDGAAAASAGPIGVDEFNRRIGARAREIEKKPPPRTDITPVAILSPMGRPGAAAAPGWTDDEAEDDAVFGGAEAGAGGLADTDGDELADRASNDADADADTDAAIGSAPNAMMAASTLPPIMTHMPAPMAAVATAAAGKDGETLRRIMGYDQDDLNDFVRQLQDVAAYPLAAVHLLPLALWDGDLGLELLGDFNLSPYRPWNAVVLPADQQGVLDLGLPLPPRSLLAGPDDDMVTMIAGLIALSRGEADADAEAAEPLIDVLDAVQEEYPALFPPETDGMEPVAAEVRARIRAYALHRAAMAGLPLAAIETAHRTFLPEMEALAN